MVIDGHWWSLVVIGGHWHLLINYKWWWSKWRTKCKWQLMTV